jgi:hypothetical protein
MPVSFLQGLSQPLTVTFLLELRISANLNP